MGIPEQAERVFKGVIFDVYQWDQAMFDGSTARFEMLRRPGTVLVIPVMDGKIVLARESQPTMEEKYTFFGGRVEEGEEALTAAKRELREESGLASDDWELFSVDAPYAKIDWVISTYIARNCRKVAEPTLDAGERIVSEAFDFDAFVEKASAEAFPETSFSNRLYRMRSEGKLDELRKRLWQTASK